MLYYEYSIDHRFQPIYIITNKIMKQTNQSPQASKTTPLPQNPRKAATRFKQMNNQIQMMKRRFKVLQGQEDYNRYRTVDNQRRINQHASYHQKITKDRQQLRKSLEKVNDISQVKEKTVLMREQLRDRLRSVRNSILEQRTQRYQTVLQQQQNHQEKIKQNKERDHIDNRDKKLSVQRDEQVKRESLSRHQEERVRSIKVNKSIDAQRISKKTEKRQQELEKLLAYEKELIEKNSVSLQASQLMKNKFNSVFPGVNSKLPEIRARTNNSQNSKGTLTMSSEGVIIL